MRCALDTTLLVYAVGSDSDEKAETIRSIIERVPGKALVIPVQVAGELARVLNRKLKLSAARTTEIVNDWLADFDAPPTTASALEAALTLVSDHQLQLWDAVILAVAAESGCDLLLSEDYHHGFAWHGVTVINPFTHPDHKLIRRLTERRA